MAIAIQPFMFKVLDFWDGPGLRLFAALFIFVDAKKTSNFRDYISLSTTTITADLDGHTHAPSLLQELHLLGMCHV